MKRILGVGYVSRICTQVHWLFGHESVISYVLYMIYWNRYFNISILAKIKQIINFSVALLLV